MFFIISKISAFLLSPLTWIIILLVVGLFIKNAKRKRKIYIATVVFSLFFTNPAIIDELLRLWEEPMTIIDEKTTYEAGIVLGGGMVDIDNDYNRLIFRENTDRFLQALTLYKQGRIKKIVLSGGSGSLVFKKTIEAVLIKRYLTEIGVPDNDILIDYTSDNTYQNAVNCTNIIKTKCGKGNFLLITSALHMKRAKDCFSNQGICVSTYPTNIFVGPRRTDVGYYLIPDTEALIRWNKFIHEILGYFIYTVMGYI
jgi:uncharacterized SAM-binding protein YcdF (DUF218 family)